LRVEVPLKNKDLAGVQKMGNSRSVEKLTKESSFK
jgi:hypothetical protein